MNSFQFAMSIAIFISLSTMISFFIAYKLNDRFNSLGWICIVFFVSVIFGFLGIFPANILKNFIFKIPEISPDESVPLISCAFFSSIIGGLIGVFVKIDGKKDH